MSEILEPIVLIDYEKGEEAHIVTYTVNTFEEILYAAKRINQDLFNGDWQLSFLDENKQPVDIGKEEILEDYLEKDIQSFYWAYREKKRKKTAPQQSGGSRAASARQKTRKKWRGSEGAQAANRAPKQQTQKKGAPTKVRQIKRKKYAHVGKRIIAFWIDRLIIAMLAMMIFRAGPAAIGLIWWLYFAITESSKHQASFGKRVMGLKVEHTEGRGLTFTEATVRVFARFLLSFGAIVALFTKKRQTLHDLVTKTIVLDTDD
ncbi:MAG: RDD family protein [Chitinophagales bacterium]